MKNYKKFLMTLLIVGGSFTVINPIHISAEIINTEEAVRPDNQEAKEFIDGDKKRIEDEEFIELHNEIDLRAGNIPGEEAGEEVEEIEEVEAKNVRLNEEISYTNQEIQDRMSNLEKIPLNEQRNEFEAIKELILQADRKNCDIQSGDIQQKNKDTEQDNLRKLADKSFYLGLNYDVIFDDVSTIYTDNSLDHDVLFDDQISKALINEVAEIRLGDNDLTLDTINSLKSDLARKKSSMRTTKFAKRLQICEERLNDLANLMTPSENANDNDTDFESEIAINGVLANLSVLKEGLIKIDTLPTLNAANLEEFYKLAASFGKLSNETLNTEKIGDVAAVLAELKVNFKECDDLITKIYDRHEALSTSTNDPNPNENTGSKLSFGNISSVVWSLSESQSSSNNSSSSSSSSTQSNKEEKNSGTTIEQRSKKEGKGSAEIPTSFTDVSKVPWAHTALNRLLEKGILSGLTFKPNESVTRADFIGWMVQALELKSKTSSGQFKDVDASNKYAEEIAIAKSLGLAKGYQDKFSPESSLTREDMMVLVERAITLANKKLSTKEADLSKFADHAQVSAYAKKSIAKLVDSGIVKGDGKNLTPKKMTSRAEAVVIIDRLLDL